MEHIKARLAEYLSKANLKTALLGVALQEALGKETDKVSFHAFRAGVLWIKVASPAWATELMSKKTEIMRKINVLLGEKLIKDIKTLVYLREDFDNEDKKG